MPNDNGVYIENLDFNILNFGQKDGRMSFTDIAKSSGISDGTMRNRFIKMIEEKTMQIIGRVNPHHIGYNAPATIPISIGPQFMDIAIEEMVNFSEVCNLSVLKGEYDVMLDIISRDANHLAGLFLKRLGRVKSVIDFRPALIFQIHKYAQPKLYHPNLPKQTNRVLFDRNSKLFEKN